MISDRESMVDDLVRRALDLPEDERSAFLDRVREDDAVVGRRLLLSLRLLGTHDDFLESSPLVDLRDLTTIECDRQALVEPTVLDLPVEIGSYTLVERLGSGGSGSVYLGEQRLPRREVAVKLVSVPGDDDRVLRSIQDEVDALGRLRHSGIAQIYEARVLEHDGHRLALMAVELVESAMPIDAYCCVRGSGVRSCVGLISQVAGAVHHAHQKGIIHRDLKPANILVDASGVPKVIDFGIAGIVERVQPDEDVVRGSWRYMSPEHLDGVGATETRSDVYSLAVVLYELLAGRQPYGGTAPDLSGFIRALREEEPEPIASDGVDDDLMGVVRRGLSKDADGRYESMGAFADDLRRWLEYEPVHARPPGLGRSLSLLARRRPISVSLVGAALSMLVSITVVSLLLYVRSEGFRRDLIDAREREREQTSRAREAMLEIDGLQSVLASALRRGRSDGVGTDIGFVETLATRVGLLQTAGERRELISAAVATLRRIELESNGDLELLGAIAATYEQVGDLTAFDWSASAEEAASVEEPYARSVELWDRLSREREGDATVWAGLASSSSRLSQTLRKLQRAADAVAAGDTSVAAAERYMSLTNGSVESRLSLVGALWARGDACIREGPQGVGLADSERAVAVLEAIGADGPADPGTQTVLAWSHFRLGVWLHRQFNDEERGFVHARRANELHLSVCRSHPSNERAVTSLLRYASPELDLLRIKYGEDAVLDRSLEISDAVDVALRSARHASDVVASHVEARLILIDWMRQAGRESGARERAAALASWLGWGGWGGTVDAKTAASVLVTAAELHAASDPIFARRAVDRSVELGAGELPELRERVASVLGTLGSSE